MAPARYVRGPMWRHLGEYLAVRLVVCLVQALSLPACARLSKFLGWLAHNVLGVRAEITRANLAHAYPELSPRRRESLARAMWTHLFLLVCEIAHLPRKVHETTWRKYVRLVDAERLVQRLLDERPVVIGSAHFGNFELAGYMLGLFGWPTYTVARTLDNPYLDRFVNRFRVRKGQRMIPKDGGAEQVIRVLAQGGTMVFLADQYAGQKGCWVEFFGREVSAHKAIALFSLAHDAPMVVGAATRVDGPLQYEMRVSGIADPRDNTPETAGVRPLTAWYTQQLESMIRLAPAQYWWLHDRWRERQQKAPRRRARKAA